VKLYSDEPGHQQVRALEAPVVSALARVEVPAAFWGKARAGELDDAEAALLTMAFELDFHGSGERDPRFTVVALGEPLLVAAAREAARHGLRAYDAVQLATALAVRAADPDCASFACFDRDLRRAASRAGLALVP
jgi:predicted nucleic acid-binding protein